MQATCAEPMNRPDIIDINAQPIVGGCTPFLAGQTIAAGEDCVSADPPLTRQGIKIYYLNWTIKKVHVGVSASTFPLSGKNGNGGIFPRWSSSPKWRLPKYKDLHVLCEFAVVGRPLLP